MVGIYALAYASIHRRHSSNAVPTRQRRAATGSATAHQTVSRRAVACLARRARHSAKKRYSNPLMRVCRAGDTPCDFAVRRCWPASAGHWARLATLIDFSAKDLLCRRHEPAWHASRADAIAAAVAMMICKTTRGFGDRYLLLFEALLRGFI